MKCDLVLAGVGGQGVLSIAALIAPAAVAEGLHVKQCEIHGMAQRGAAVFAHLRIADRPVWSDLIPTGSADLILSLEPLEALRYVDHLAPDGSVVSSTHPIRNFPAYPDLDDVLGQLRALPNAHLIDADALAREAGSFRAVNTVMVGAAAPLLPIPRPTLEHHIRQVFAPKGEQVVRVNLDAFRLGTEAMACVPA